MTALPEAFLSNIRNQLGDETPAFLRALEEPAALALRLNPLRRGAADAAAPYVDAPVPWAVGGFYLRQEVSVTPGASVTPVANVAPGASIAHAAGAFYLQEASAMASAAVLDTQPGELVLDLCAAPGGKSTQIAAALAGAGALVSNDPEPSRARALAGNLERMGAANAVVVSALPHRLAAAWPEAFDAVLVDAPCSGEGMFRRDPATRAEWTPAAPEGCAKRQAQILDQAALLVRPGGRLVYSTCTFNALENEGSVRGFLARHPDFAPEDFALPGVGTSTDGMLRLWPHRLRGDGHFVAKLRRAGDAPEPAVRRIAPPDRDCARLLEALERDVCPLPDALRDMRVLRLGDWLFARAARCPDVTGRSGPAGGSGLRVVSPGLQLLRVGRNHIEPAHALAMALPPEVARRVAELDEAQARAWLRGEALAMDGADGWTLVMHRGLPLSWGKCAGGTLKNHLPKGLRRR